MKHAAISLRQISRVRRLSVAAAAALALAHSAEAASALWLNTATDFNTGANWTGGTGPGGIPGTADNATFSAVVPAFQPDLSAPLTIQGLTFSTPAGGWTLGSGNGSLLTLTNTGTTTASAINAANTSGTDTINAGLVLGGAASTLATITQTRLGTLVISGNIASTNAITGLSLATNGATGTATFTLSGNNSYSGTTAVVANEILNINSPTALSAGTLIFNGSATIDNTSATAALVLANSNNINLSGGSLTYTGTAGNSLSFGSGVLTVGGANRTATISGGTVTIGSINADTIARTFTKAGAGTLVITGAAGANFQGGFALTGGVLLIAAGADLGSGNLTLSGGALQASADLSGGGKILNTVLLSTGTTVSGANNIEFGGKLTGATGASRTLTSSITGGGVLTLNNVDLSNDTALARTLTIAGSGTTTINGLIANGTGTTTANGLIVTNSGTTTINNAGNTFTGGVTLNNANATLPLVADSVPSTAGSTVTSGPLGAGTFTITAGTVTAVGGARTIANTVLFGNASSAIGGSNNLTFNGAATWGGSNTLTINNSGLTTFSGSAFTLRNGTGTTPQAQRSLTLAGTGDLVLSAPVVNGFTVNGIITLNGSGTTTFSGNNSHSGNTSINAGMLKLGHANALGFGGVSVVAGSTNVGSLATLDLNGQAGVTEQITLNGTGVGGNGGLINSNTGTTASIGSGVSALAVTASGSGYSAAPLVTISGTGTGATAVATLGLTPATFTLTPGDKFYTTAPTVTIAGGGGQGAVAAAVLSGGSTGTVVGITIATDARGTAYTSAPTIAFSGGTATGGTTDTTGVGNAANFTVSALQVTAPGSGYAGTLAVTFDSGVAAATALGSGLVLAGTSDNAIGGAGSIIINGRVSGGGISPLTKIGGGTLTLNGANTYLGPTTINAGTLAVGGGAAIADTGTVTIAAGVPGAVLLLNGSETIAWLAGGGSAGGAVQLGANTLTTGDANNTAFAGNISGTGGALVKQGAGIFTLTGTNSHTGGTSVSNGVLNINADAALGAANGPVALGNSAILQAADTAVSITSAGARVFTLTGTGGKIDTNGQIVTLDTATTVTGTTLEKIGAGTLNLKGMQTYDTLTASGGTTNLRSLLGTGTSTINASASVNITVGQKLAALIIADGVVVTLGGGPEAAPFAGELAPSSSAIPEPAALALLGLGALGMMSRRRARN